MTAPADPSAGTWWRTRRVSRRHVVAAMGASAAGLGLLAGCVSIPTTGPVEPANARPEQPNPSLEVRARPPEAGATALSVVSGFLQAMAFYQTDYAVAREYLASSVRSSWRPEDGVGIYANDYFPQATEKSATLVAPRTGQLAADGSYESATGTVSIDFGLVRENGQWRIGHPPTGLLISEYDFDQFYRSYNLYFFEPRLGSLVPDPIFLPAGDQSPTSLITRLLRGPTRWLQPAVVTAIPTGTALNLSAPVAADGVVEVSLSDPVSALADDRRRLLAAQIGWTLRQIPAVTGIRFQVNGTPWAVPGATNNVVPVTAFDNLSPIASAVSGQLVGATADGVVRIDDDGGRLTALDGPWGSTKSVSSVAMSADGGEVSGVVGAELRTGALTASGLKKLLTGERLLRPQYSRFGELWVIDSRSSGASTVWMIRDGKAHRLTATGLGAGRVTAFRISPDGVRLALVELTGTRTTLGVARIDRTRDLPTVGAWRTIGLERATEQPATALTDVGWLDDSSLMVLAAGAASSPPSPYVVTADGSSARAAGTPDQWTATQLATSPRDVPQVKAVLRAQDGQVWRYDDDYQWVSITKGLTGVAFPG